MWRNIHQNHRGKLGLGVVAMGPVGGGRLMGMPDFLREEQGLDTSSAARLALRFVLSNPAVHVALSGMGSREMVDENVTAADGGTLSAKEQVTLNALLAETRKLADLYCTGCGYCIPCKQGVDIPGRFAAMNYLKAYGHEQFAKTAYRKVRRREQKAEGRGECVECRVCEGKCPQKIPIVEQLRETATALAAD